jgi:hypothetical protein
MYPALKQNLVGHRFLDDGEVETVATRRLITWNADFVNVEYESSCHDIINNRLSGWSSAEECDSRSIKYELLLLHM